MIEHPPAAERRPYAGFPVDPEEELSEAWRLFRTQAWEISPRGYSDDGFPNIWWIYTAHWHGTFAIAGGKTRDEAVLEAYRAFIAEARKDG